MNGVEDNDVSLFKLNGAVDQTIVPRRRIGVILVWIQPAEVLGHPCFWVIREEMGRRKGPSPDLSVRCCRETADKGILFSCGLSEILPYFDFWVEAKKMSMIVTPEVDPVPMIQGPSPGTHLRRKRTIKLPDLTRIRMDGEKKKRSLVLTERKVDRILGSRISRPHISSPQHGISDRDTEVALSEGDVWKVQEDKKGNGNEKPAEARIHNKIH
jgi:hypothetical protein